MLTIFFGATFEARHTGLTALGKLKDQAGNV
jgi:hypothetical protein